jgi:hypothetical protein
MSTASDSVFVADALVRLHAAAGLPWPPPGGPVLRPVPLDRLIATYNLVHSEVPALTPAVAAAYLERWGVQQPELFKDVTPLAGFLFANARGGYILVRADDPLPRRRFTAAHELGHYLLHFLPRLEAGENADACLVKTDGADNVCEDEKPAGEDGPTLPVMERQANRFAAELLMPVELCRAACARYSQRFATTTRFLEHQLAGELLVSREAVRWRLRSLKLDGDRLGFYSDRPPGSKTASPGGIEEASGLGAR